MQIQIFSIPVHSNQEQTDEMNKFLRSHKIIDIEKHFVADENNAYWTFCIRYILSPLQITNEKKEKTDYKAELDEPTFTIFSKLRECRKVIADKEALPAYAIFTNDELASIAKLPVIDSSQLLTINGVGKNKLEKYGNDLIELFYKK